MSTTLQDHNTQILALVVGMASFPPGLTNYALAVDKEIME